MKIQSIKFHLKPYKIFEKRMTTINHAFASSIAPNDDYDENKLKKAITLLGQNPEEDLKCVYCDKPAETWDHVYGLVKESKFFGYGHVIGNLIPCCKKCNSEKGNRDWKEFIKKKRQEDSTAKIELLNNYFKEFLPIKFDYNKIKEICPKEIDELDKIKDQIENLFKNADIIADNVRKKLITNNNTK